MSNQSSDHGQSKFSIDGAAIGPKNHFKVEFSFSKWILKVIGSDPKINMVFQISAILSTLIIRRVFEASFSGSKVMPENPNSGYFGKIFGLVKPKNIGYQSIWLDELRKNMVSLLRSDNPFSRYSSKTDHNNEQGLSY